MELKSENIEIVDKIKLLGTIITNKLTWDENCSFVITKVNSRMELLRKCKSFGATEAEMVKLWVTYCRPILEQSCSVWDSSLTEENISDLERTQKSFCKLVLQNKYYSYENSFLFFNLDSLQTRRKILNTKFAQQGILNKKLNDLFPINEKHYNFRKPEKYKVLSANTEKLRRGSVIQMQHLLNSKEIQITDNETVQKQKKRKHG